MVCRSIQNLGRECHSTLRALFKQPKDALQMLGPFPMHAREQHFLSPSYPLNCAFAVRKHVYRRVGRALLSFMSDCLLVEPTVSNLPFHVDPDERWYSSYADGAQIGWSTAQSDDKGNLEVSFPKIRYVTRAWLSECSVDRLTAQRQQVVKPPPIGRVGSSTTP